jgi:hypothetical protein
MTLAAGGAGLGILFILVFWIAPVVAAYAIGNRKGRTYGWVWGLLLGWIGVVIVAVLPRKSVASWHEEEPALPRDEPRRAGDTSPFPSRRDDETV